MYINQFLNLSFNFVIVIVMDCFRVFFLLTANVTLLPTSWFPTLKDINIIEYLVGKSSFLIIFVESFICLYCKKKKKKNRQRTSKIFF